MGKQKSIDLVLSCVFNGSIEIMIDQIKNIIAHNPSVHVVYKLNAENLAKIKSNTVKFPETIHINETSFLENNTMGNTNTR